MLFGGALLTTAALSYPPLSAWLTRFIRAEPLSIGLTPQQQAILAVVRKQTSATARILWEDRRGTPGMAQWTALLPLWTERAYVGGLDPEASIEHTTAGLVEGNLVGRPLGEWTDAELKEFCDRYNVGWVVGWSPRTVQRLSRSSLADAATSLPAPQPGEPAGLLIALRRKHNFALCGAARLIGADPQRIVLADVRPQRRATDDGRGHVVLSLHYQAGMRAVPSRVRLERAEELQDTIPFVRLVVADPVTRVTITWDKR
jgi:hypothetical protein